VEEKLFYSLNLLEKSFFGIKNPLLNYSSFTLFFSFGFPCALKITIQLPIQASWVKIKAKEEKKSYYCIGLK